MSEGATAGQLAAQAARDETSYCGYEVADEMCKDIERQVQICIQRHLDYFEEIQQFCVVMLYASDCVLTNLKRRKFYGFPFLPKPRPSQTVWLYDKPSDTYRMLWCLPSADTLATLTMTTYVAEPYRRMQQWSKWFYKPGFYQKIREQHGIKMVSEEEHLEAIRKKGTKSAGEDMSPLVSNPFDAARVNPEQAVDPLIALLPKDRVESGRQAEGTNRNVADLVS